MDLIQKTEEFCKKEYSKNDSKHQWTHAKAVLDRALEIAKHFEKVDYEALKLAAMFHDVDYHSAGTFEENYQNHVEASVKVAKKFLEENDYPKERIKKVTEIMLDHSTPHRKKRGEAKTLEGKILYDSDKSLFITNKETYEKYFPKLYLEESKKLVKGR